MYILINIMYKKLSIYTLYRESPYWVDTGSLLLRPHSAGINMVGHIKIIGHMWWISIR